MHLASYNIRGRTSFGVVTGDGVVDLQPRMAPRFTSVFDLLRAEALGEVRTVMQSVRADFSLAEAEWLAPVLTPEKILVLGSTILTVTQRSSGGTEGARNTPACSFVRQIRSSATTSRSCVLRVSEQLDYRRNCAGHWPRRPAYPARARIDHVAGITFVQRGAPFATGCATVGSMSRRARISTPPGSIGPWLTTGLDLTQPLHLTVSLNNKLTQDDATASMIFSFADLIAYHHLHDHQTRRHHRDRHADEEDREAIRRAGARAG